ncbi:MAG: pyrimidine-nucleoside phosphorylase [Bacillota bacterium]|nr:pyrimidine-nucleoside phosphorylase [Bacillota bacterium]
MRVYDLILKKRNGSSLSEKEISYLVSGYVNGDIPDYQMSALAMAIYFQDMTEEETLALTRAMIESGDTINLDDIPGIKVDKHSTGGVGDTTTLVLAPLVAAAGAPVAKLSGRGLGHTGGTLDKLESIPGFRTEMTVSQLISAVKKVGVAVAGQTGNLVPADKMLYALRDVTATVDSMPLIASSIMSKKLAAGADALVLDVKTGDGAFLKEEEDAFALAELMVRIGQGAGKKTLALVTGMDQPLGWAIGNALEVEEAIMTLRGEGPADLEELCLQLGCRMLTLAGKVKDPDKGYVLLKRLIESGAALQKFGDLIKSQHGNTAVINNPSILPVTSNRIPVKSTSQGYVKKLKAEAIGIAAMILGAGRETKKSVIDPAVGLVMEKKIGDRIEKDDTLAVIHAAEDEETGVISEVTEMILSAYDISSEKAMAPELIYGEVG